MTTGTKSSPFIKDPDSTRTFGISWVDWLDGDTIATSTWTLITSATVPPLVIVTSTSTTTIASVKLSGGQVLSRYELRNRITTAAGESGDKTVHVKILER